MNNNDRMNLIRRISELEGLTDKERSALLGLLRESKSYGLVWEDKPEAVEDKMQEELPILKEVPERALISDAPDAPNHILHSKWLSFMSRRLRIAKQLLSDKGVIFISIDDNEQANLKLLCDEIFGEDLVETYVWDVRVKGTMPKTAKNTVRKEHEYLTVCYKSEKKLQKYSSLKYEDKNWSNPDNDARGPWMSANISRGTSNGSGGTKSFVITNPAGISFDRDWAITKEQYEALLADGRIYFSDNGRGVPRLKKFKAEPVWSIQSSFFSDLSNSQEASNLIKEILGEKKFDFPKPILLIQRILLIAGYTNSTILDFFAGSGTTLHATMQLNAEDGGHRQCILVTNNENGICENVTYERNRRVICGYTTPKGEHVTGLTNNNLRYYKTAFVPREPNNRNKRALVAAATDLLCIKNDVYQEQSVFGGHKLKLAAARYFDDGRTQMLIIYNELAVDAFVRVIAGMEVGGRIKVYVFSNNRYAYTDNFEPVADKVEVCALPAAIYDAYQKVLKPRKRNGNAPAADTPFAEETTPEAEQGTFHFKEEGGEA